MSRVFVYSYTSDGKTLDLKRYVMNRQQALEIASCTQKLASAPCYVSDQNQQHKFSHRY